MENPAEMLSEVRVTFALVPDAATVPPRKTDDEFARFKLVPSRAVMGPPAAALLWPKVIVPSLSEMPPAKLLSPKSVWVPEPTFVSEPAPPTFPDREYEVLLLPMVRATAFVSTFVSAKVPLPSSPPSEAVVMPVPKPRPLPW